MLTIHITGRYLVMPIEEAAPLKTYWIHAGNIHPFDLKLRLSSDPDFWVWMDTAEFEGEDLGIEGDLSPEVAQMLYVCDDLPRELTVRQEKLRPYLHMTPLRGWVNDPNGMYYQNGAYHLFYQHNPYDTRWENMHWGHAVSTDLLHWQELAETLRPDESGAMFSGSAVVDHENVSKLGKNGIAPILLFYTAAGGINEASKGKECSICLAYSTDEGQTFAKYIGNPILAPYVHDNRDPKVFYYAPDKRFCMVLFLEEHRNAIFSSADLIHWRYESEIDLPPLNECPDLFPLPGDTQDRWVFLSGADLHWEGAVGKYYIGTFDGHSFVPQEGPYKLDEGRDLYSTQTFDNAPNGRRILMSWRSRRFDGTGFEGMPFNGEFTLPLELFGFNEADSRTKLGKYPVQEILLDAEAKAKFRWKELFIPLGEKRTLPLDEGGIILLMDMEMPANGSVTLDLGGEEAVLDSSSRTLTCMDCTVAIPVGDARLRLLAVRDKTSIELYLQEGRYGINSYCSATNATYTLCAQGTSLHIYSMWAAEYKS